MKITKLKTAVVEANFQWTYVRIYSDADGGLYGTGECFFAPGLPAIISEFAGILVGEDPYDIERLVEKMRWASSGAGSLAGIILNAISGIEAALWDLKGKAIGVPVSQLLGGKFRSDVRLYLDCHAEGALEALSPLLQQHTPAWERKGVDRPALTREQIITASAERASQLAREGWSALKFDLDLPGSTFDAAAGYSLTGQDIEWMISLVTTIRAAVGLTVDLAFDAHWRYRPSEILQVMKQIEAARLLWLEDPLPPHDLDGLAYLRQHTATPIGTGENLQLRSGFWELLARDLVDVVAPDFQKVGGLAEAKKIADLAALRNKPIAPHMIGSPVALLASCQVAATIPNFLACEFHAYDVPFCFELVDNAHDWFRPGCVTIPNRPGIGTELNESVARRYALPGSKWFDTK